MKGSWRKFILNFRDPLISKDFATGGAEATFTGVRDGDGALRMRKALIDSLEKEPLTP